MMPSRNSGAVPSNQFIQLFLVILNLGRAAKTGAALQSEPKHDSPDDRAFVIQTYPASRRAH